MNHVGHVQANMLFSASTEQDDHPHHSDAADEHQSSPELLLQRRGSQQNHPRGSHRGRCFPFHTTGIAAPWHLRLAVMAAIAVLMLVALGGAATQAHQVNQAHQGRQAQILNQEVHKEHRTRLPTETKLLQHPGAEVHSTLAANLDQDGLPRMPRSPISPPTITSLQPHRRGISKAMHDSSLQVGRQSEGPSHPSLMRKAPPRRLATTLLTSTDHVASPHTLHHLTREEPADHLQAEAASLQGSPHHSSYYGGYLPQYESGSENMYLSQTRYQEYEDYPQEQQYQENVHRINMKIERDAEDERRSRQRRVENSFPGHVDERTLARHGRFDESLGSRHETSLSPERQDTFGHPITEELWTGHRRTPSSVHPAARGVSSRGRAPPSADDNSIWSRSPSHGFRWPRTHHTSATQNTQPGRTSTAVAGGTSKGSGHILFHPGSKMTSRGSVTRSEVPFNRETLVIQESGNGGVSHPRMFRPRGSSAPKEPLVANTLSLTDVMVQTNQTYGELTQNLEKKGLSLTYFLRMLSNGASIDEVLEILEFSKSTVPAGYTTIRPISQTIDPIVWEQWLTQEVEEQNREIESVNSHPVEIDRRGGDPYFSDPVYAVGVHPISEELETFQENYADGSADQVTELPYQPSNYSYDDYYLEIKDDDSMTSGQARIHSFTVHEIPSDGTAEEDKTGNYERNDFSSWPASNAHPHFNPLDQLPSKQSDDQYGVANDKLTSSSGHDVHTKNILDEQDSWGLHRSGPLTYTVIAASAIMGSLAVFTLFVLVAYSIVKCTKKPMLNNYQVSDKKPVEITS